MLKCQAKMNISEFEILVPAFPKRPVSTIFLHTSLTEVFLWSLEMNCINNADTVCGSCSLPLKTVLHY